MWQYERERGRRPCSFSAGMLAEELLYTSSINVVSNLLVTTEFTAVVVVQKQQGCSICCED